MMKSQEAAVAVAIRMLCKQCDDLAAGDVLRVMAPG
jgi:hypothetical protein